MGELGRMIPFAVVSLPGLLLPRSSAPPGLRVEYFAFGSNMATSVFQGRRGIRPLGDKRPAVAHGKKLAFTVPGIPIFEPAFASIEPAAPDSECHGVLYSLSPSDFGKLCFSEGAPLVYRVLEIPVVQYNGVRLSAFAFQSSTACLGEMKPSMRYLQLIQDAAREAGLAQSWLDELDRISAAPGSRQPQILRDYERRRGATFVRLTQRANGERVLVSNRSLRPESGKSMPVDAQHLTWDMGSLAGGTPRRSFPGMCIMKRTRID